MSQTLYETYLVGTNSIQSVIYLIAIFFAIYIIITKNPVISVLFLIGLFFSVSIYLMSIGLSFLGFVYLIVYVGAVSILFLFILMLINVRVSELLSDSRNSVPLAILTILCFNYSVNDILPYSIYIYDLINAYSIKLLSSFTSNIMPVQFLNSTYDIVTCILRYLLFTKIGNVSSKSWDAIMVTYSHITSIGNILYTNLFVLFIITSLILLLAMVGAIIITINKTKINYQWYIASPNKVHDHETKLESNIADVISEITRSLDQYKEFIQQFNQTVNEHNLNVITDGNNCMSLDVPNSMSEEKATEVVKKVRIIDSLIKAKQESLSKTFSDTLTSENKTNPELLNLSQKFKQARDSYKH